jgi:hypothetical protein
MLNQYDIDIIKQRLQNGEDVYLYYVASLIETREGLLDEHIYKSVPHYTVVKVKCTDVVNAYFELLNFKNNPDNYHIETEETYLAPSSKYIKYYSVPNKKESYDKDFTASMPSIIYGYRRKLIEHKCGEDKITEFNEESPVKPVYTNNPEYGDLHGQALQDALDTGLLDWKYMKVDAPIYDDGINYYYIYTDWYILDIENFPRTEKPLINTKQYSTYFMDIYDAFNYMRQLEA